MTIYVSAPRRSISLTLISGVSSGQKTVDFIPALVAYAAKAAPALPFVGIAKWLRFNCFAIETAIANPLALNEEVGSNPSSLIRTVELKLKFFKVLSNLISGVTTSPKEIRFSFFSTGNINEYRQNPGSSLSAISSLEMTSPIFFKSYRTKSGFPPSDKP